MIRKMNLIPGAERPGSVGRFITGCCKALGWSAALFVAPPFAQPLGVLAVDPGPEVRPVKDEARGLGPALGGNVRAPDARLRGFRTNSDEMEAGGDLKGDSTLTMVLDIFKEEREKAGLNDIGGVKVDTDIDYVDDTDNNSRVNNDVTTYERPNEKQHISEVIAPRGVVSVGMPPEAMNLATVSDHASGVQDDNTKALLLVAESPSDRLSAASDIVKTALAKIIDIKKSYKDGDIQAFGSAIKSVLNDVEPLIQVAGSMGIASPITDVDVSDKSSLLNGITSTQFIEYLSHYAATYDILEKRAKLLVDVLDTLNQTLFYPKKEGRKDKFNADKQPEDDFFEFTSPQPGLKEASQSDFTDDKFHTFDFHSSPPSWHDPHQSSWESLGQFHPKSFLHSHAFHNTISTNHIPRHLANLDLFNSEEVKVRHELRVNALGDRCPTEDCKPETGDVDPGFSDDDHCKCVKLFGCVNRMSAYDFAFLLASGYVETDQNSDKYGKFTVKSVNDLNLFNAEKEGLGKMLQAVKARAKIQKERQPKVRIADCIAVLQNFHYPCESFKGESKSKCTEANSQSFQATIDQVCDAVNTPTKLLFESIGAEFDSFREITQSNSGICYPTSYSTCGEFVKLFDRFYELRDKSIYPLPNPMRDTTSALRDMSIDQVFNHVNFPNKYLLYKDKYGVSSGFEAMVSFKHGSSSKVMSVGECASPSSVVLKDTDDISSQFFIVGRKIISAKCPDFVLGTNTCEVSPITLQRRSIDSRFVEWSIENNEIRSIGCRDGGIAVVPDITGNIVQIMMGKIHLSGTTNKWKLKLIPRTPRFFSKVSTNKVMSVNKDCQEGTEVNIEDRRPGDLTQQFYFNTNGSIESAMCPNKGLAVYSAFSYVDMGSGYCTQGGNIYDRVLETTSDSSGCTAVCAKFETKISYRGFSSKQLDGGHACKCFFDKGQGPSTAVDGHGASGEVDGANKHYKGFTCHAWRRSPGYVDMGSGFCTQGGNIYDRLGSTTSDSSGCTAVCAKYETKISYRGFSSKQSDRGLVCRCFFDKGQEDSTTWDGDASGEVDGANKHYTGWTCHAWTNKGLAIKSLHSGCVDQSNMGGRVHLRTIQDKEHFQWKLESGYIKSKCPKVTMTINDDPTTGLIHLAPWVSSAEFTWSWPNLDEVFTLTNMEYKKAITLPISTRSQCGQSPQQLIAKPESSAKNQQFRYKDGLIISELCPTKVLYIQDNLEGDCKHAENKGIFLTGIIGGNGSGGGAKCASCKWKFSDSGYITSDGCKGGSKSLAVRISANGALSMATAWGEDNPPTWRLDKGANYETSYIPSFTGHPGKTDDKGCVGTVDKRLATKAMISCDKTMQLLAGPRMSLGTLKAIVDGVENGGPGKMPGVCCLDNALDSQQFGYNYNPATMVCKNKGPWHLGLAKETCVAAGGHWTRTPCSTLKACIDDRPKKFNLEKVSDLDQINEAVESSTNPGYVVAKLNDPKFVNDFGLSGVMYVKVTFNGQTHLLLDEVKVFVLVDGTEKNFALESCGAIATQSNTRGNYDASKAIDGIIHNPDPNGCAWAIDQVGKRPWWKVKLCPGAQQHTITRVVIWESSNFLSVRSVRGARVSMLGPMNNLIAEMTVDEPTNTVRNPTPVFDDSRDDLKFELSPIPKVCFNFCYSLPDYKKQIGMVLEEDEKGDDCVCLYENGMAPKRDHLSPPYATRNPPTFYISDPNSGLALGLSPRSDKCTDTIDAVIEAQNQVVGSLHQQFQYTYDGRLINLACPENVLTAEATGELKLMKPYSVKSEFQTQQWISDNVKNSPIKNVHHQTMISAAKGDLSFTSNYFAIVNPATNLAITVDIDDDGTCLVGTELSLRPFEDGSPSQNFKYVGSHIFSIKCTNLALGLNDCKHGTKITLVHQDEGAKSKTECTDKPSWTDEQNHDCAYYEKNGCPNIGLDNDGVSGTANESCCHCGGGDFGPSSTPYECADTPNWMDRDGETCQYYIIHENACSLYGDEYMANDNCCHCGGGTWSSSSAPSLCTDGYNWKNAWGLNCAWYEENDEPGCPQYGDEKQEIGGKGTAKVNCCYCGGGTWKEGMIEWTINTEDGVISSNECENMVIGANSIVSHFGRVKFNDQGVATMSKTNPFTEEPFDEIKLPAIGTKVTLANRIGGTVQKYQQWKQKFQQFRDILGPFYYFDLGGSAMGHKEQDLCHHGMKLQMQAYDSNAPGQKFYIGYHGVIFSSQCRGLAIGLAGANCESAKISLQVYQPTNKQMKWKYTKDGILENGGCPSYAATQPWLTGDITLKPLSQSDNAQIWKRENTRLLETPLTNWVNNWSVEYVDKDFTDPLHGSVGKKVRHSFALTSAFSPSFEDFARELVVENDAEEEKCNEARAGMGYDMDYPFDTDVCQKFQQLLCKGREFAGIDYLESTKSTPPKLPKMTVKPIEYEHAEYDPVSYNAPEYEDDPPLPFKKFPKVTDWVVATSHESEDKKSIVEMQDKFLHLKTALQVLERALQMQSEFSNDGCSAIPGVIPAPFTCLPNPGKVICRLTSMVAKAITFALVAALSTAENLASNLFDVSDKPDVVAYANDASRKTYDNLKNLDAFAKESLKVINQNIKNQHTDMRQHLQTRHLALEKNLGQGLIDAQNALGKRIVEAQNKNGQMIQAAQEPILKNLCAIYKQFGGTCSRTIGPFEEGQLSIPFDFYLPEGHVSLSETLQHSLSKIHKALAVGDGTADVITDENSRKVGGAESNGHTVQEKIEVMEENVKIIQDNIGAMEVKMDNIGAMNEKVEVIQGNIGAMNKKVDTIEAKVGKMMKMMANMMDMMG